MKPISTDQLIDALRWRYATKQFDAERKIPQQTWEALEDSLVLSPSSFGLQPWKFIVIGDQQVRETLVDKSWGQRQVIEASHLVVFAVKDPVTADDVARHIDHTSTVRSQPRESLEGFENIINGFISNVGAGPELQAWASRQVYIALGNFMTSAALLGIDTCPMEGIDPKAYDEILGITGSGYKTLVACPAGYRHSDDKHASLPKVRFPKDHLVHYHS